MTTTSIGFIGLGQMGGHMAANLMQPDVRLTVCARTPARLEHFHASGANGTTKARELAACDIIFLCLPGDAEVKDVLLGEKGLIPLLHPGQLLVDCSTISYETTREAAQAATARDVGFLDAPVSGMEARAKDGTLSIMVGGEKAHLEKARPFLARMGSTILHMGPVGSGQLTKLVNQLLFNINMAALAEILPLAVKMGLDPVKTGQIINSGTGRSHASEFFIPRILAGSFNQGYPLDHAYKDIVNGTELAAQKAIPLPVLQAAAATYQTALCKGLGHEDKGAMIKVFEDLLNVHYRA